MLKDLKFADYFTLGNLICGMLSIFSSIKLNFKLTLIFLFVAVIFSMLSRFIARLFKQQNKLGMQLDLLADMISFGLALAVLVYQNGFIDTMSLIIIGFFLLTSAIRVAYFNVVSDKNKGFFIGMPITMNALIISLAYLLLPLAWLIWIVLLDTILMISPFKFKKFG